MSQLPTGPDLRREAVFIDAAYEGKVGLCRDLLNQGVDIHAAGLFKETALQSAAEGKHTAVIELLLTYGQGRYETFNEDLKKQVQAVDAKGDTALAIAVRTGSVEAVNLLLEAGSDVHRAVKSGDTPLHQAVDAEDEPMVRLLVSRGANPNVFSKEGRSALFRAASLGNGGLCDLLIQAGGDVTLKSGRYTPLSVAKRKGFMELADRMHAMSSALKAERAISAALDRQNAIAGPAEGCSPIGADPKLAVSVSSPIGELGLSKRPLLSAQPAPCTGGDDPPLTPSVRSKTHPRSSP